MRTHVLSFLLLLAASSCRVTETLGELPADHPDRVAIEAVLDDFHRAAAEADLERYFGHMSPDCVFLGTDATERWTRDEFRGYAEPRFATGAGWTYLTIERHVFLGPDERTAWFDERLRNDTYGDCRGTGALRRLEGVWKVAHYNLTFPIPNALAAEVVERIRTHGG